VAGGREIMKSTEMLLIGGLVVGGYVLMTSGIFSPKPPYVPTDNPGGTGREVYNVDAANDAWRRYIERYVEDKGFVPTNRERVIWWREQIGFEEEAAWELVEWELHYWNTFGNVMNREQMADQIRVIADRHGYVERT
jgi:hypothetical protein